MFELMDAYSQNAVIKVLGVGGGGGNAVKHMVTSGIEGVDFICANTDAQALNSARVKTARLGVQRDAARSAAFLEGWIERKLPPRSQPAVSAAERMAALRRRIAAKQL